MAVLHPANETVFARAAVRLNELEQLPVGAALHAGLIELRGMSLGSAAAVRATALWVKMTSHCQAQSMVTATEAVEGADLLVFASGHDAKQIIGEELAAMNHLSSGASIDHLYLVAQVGATLPLSWEALDRGDLTLDHLKRLARVTKVCGPRVAQAVDSQLIPRSIERGWTPQKLAKEAERAIILIDPDGAAKRAETEKAGADVRLYPGQNETSTLEADGDAVTLQQVMDAIDARAAELAADCERLPIGLRRFNALADLVLGEQAASPRVEVALTIDLTTWLGLTKNPGELSGFGPITPETARELAKDAAFRRLITDPITGRALDLGHDRYRPSEPLRRFIEARDRTCRFPGCSRRATHSDIDHVKERDHADPSNGGRTDAANLLTLCRMHHNLKTRKLWHVDINPDGTEVWTSPLGFVYRKPAATYPIDLLEPPDEIDIPEQTDAIPEHDPDPPVADEPLPTPPPLTDDEFKDFVDAIDRGFGAFAERAYDCLRAFDLIG